MRANYSAFLSNGSIVKYPSTVNWRAYEDPANQVERVQRKRPIKPPRGRVRGRIARGAPGCRSARARPGVRPGTAPRWRPGGRILREAGRANPGAASGDRL